MIKDGAKQKKSNSKSSFARLVRLLLKFKKVIYTSLMETLDSPESSMGAAVIGLFLTWLQIVTFSFAPGFYQIWQLDSVAYYIGYFSNIINLSPLIKIHTSYTIFTIMNYVFAGLVVLALFFMFLVANIRSFKKINPIMFVAINKVFFRVMTSFLAVPTFDLLFGMLNCSANDAGTVVLSAYPSTVCFQGVHLFNTILAAGALVLFAFYGLIVSMWYFESSRIHKAPFARSPSLCNVVQFFYAFVFGILNNFFSDSSFYYFSALVLLAVALVLFYFNYIENPYFREGIAVLISLFSAVTLWSTFMLVFALVFEGSIMQGSFMIYALGLPFMIAIVLTRPDTNVDLLLLSWNKVQNSDLVTRQLQYLITIWSKKDFDKKSSIVLEGYLEIHREVCDQVDCPINNTSKEQSKNQPDDTSEMVLAFIEFNFQKSIAKFPNNIDLRLAYIFFLEERVQKSQEALKELEVLSSLKCGIERDFIVYRNRRKIQEINENSKDPYVAIENVDTSQQEVAFQSLLNRFLALMEEICVLYTEFWSHLLEEVPNLNKIKNFGSKIFYSNKKMESVWRKFYAVPSSNKARYLIFYGRFQKSILNNSFKGDEYIQKAREIIAVLANKKNDFSSLGAKPELSEFQLAAIIISGNKRNIGEITQINEAACALFGYYHNEVVGKNVKLLIPNTFNLHHDSYLERAAAAQTLGYFSKEKLIFGKSKSGYLLPMQIKIHIISGKKPQFFGKIRPFKTLQVVGFILVDYKGRIESVSAGIGYMFCFDMKNVVKENGLDFYFINLFALKEKYLDAGEEVFEEGHINQQFFNKHLHSHQLMIELTKHKHPSMLKEYYIFKFTSISEEPNTQPRISKIKLSDFQFRIDPNTQALVGQKVRVRRDLNDASEAKRTRQEATAAANARAIREAQSETYAEDIKLYRLNSGKIIEIDYITEEDADKNELEMRKEDEINKLRDQKENEEENESLIKSISNNTALKDHLEKKPMPAFMKGYILVVIILILAIGGIVFYEFLAKRTQIQNLSHYQNFYANFNLIVLEYQNLVDVNNRLMINVGATTAPFNATELTEYLSYSISQIENMESVLMSEVHFLNDAVLTGVMLNTTFTVYSATNTSSTMNYAEVIKEIVTQNLILTNSTSSVMGWADGSLAYLTVVNLLGGVWTQLVQINDIIINQMNSVATTMTTYLIIQIICLSMIIISVGMTYIFTLRFNEHTSHTFDLFLDISNSNVKKYMSRCETFAGLIQSRETDEIGSDEEEADAEEGERSILVSRKRRRNNAIKLAIPKSFFFKFALAFIALEAMLGSLFFYHNSQMSTFSSINTELNITSIVNPSFHVVFNTQNLRLLDFYSSINPTLATTLGTAVFESQFNLDSILNQAQLTNNNYHSADYLAKIYNVMNGDLCSIIDGLGTPYYAPFYRANSTYCNKLKALPDYNGFFTSGLSISLAKYQDQIRTIYSNFEILAGNQTSNTSAFPNSTCQSSSDFASLCFFNYPLFKSLYIFQHYFFNPLTQYMVRLVTADTTDTVLGTTLTVEMYLFIFFLLILAFLFAFLYLRNFLDVWQRLRVSEKMILMIPLENIRKSNYIKAFFKAMVKEIINK